MATTDTWLGISTDFEDADNWSLTAVPNSGNDVVIGSAPNSPTLTNATVAVNSILLDGSDTLGLGNGGIDVANGVTLSGSGGIAGTGNFELNGSVTANNGEQISAGGSFFEITGAVTGNALLSDNSGSTFKLDAASAAASFTFNGSGDQLTLGSTLTLTNSFTDSGTVNLITTGSGLTDNAGIKLSGGGFIFGQGTVTGPLSTGAGGGTVESSLNGTLELVNPVSAGLNLAFFIDPFSTLLLDQTPQDSYNFHFTGSSGTLALGDDLGFQGTISGMNVGNNGAMTTAIDIEGKTVTIVSESGQSGANGSITLSDGTTLNLANIGSSPWLAKTASDGNGGTDLYLLNAAPLPSVTGFGVAFPQSQFTLAEVGDFNGDGFSDLIWFNPISTEIQFTQDAGTIGGGPIAGNPFIGNWNLVGVGDFNGDGTSDLVWQRSDGVVTELQLFGHSDTPIGGGAIANNAFTDSSWKVAGVGDFNGDGDSDLVWQQTGTGLTEIQLLNGTNVVGGGAIANNPFGTDWKIVGVGDFNGDGDSDLVWQNQSSGPLNGLVELQFLNGSTMLGGGLIQNNPFGAGWNVVGVGDFNGDGKSDLVYQNQTSGFVEVQFLNGTTPIGGGFVNSALAAINLGFKVVGVGDFNGDGKPDLVFQSKPLGGTEVQLLNGLNPAGGGILALNP